MIISQHSAYLVLKRNIMRFFLSIIICFFIFQQKAFCTDVIDELLVAKPEMKDQRFKKTVIVMLFNNKEGAAGLVINKPIEKIHIKKLLKNSNLNPQTGSTEKKIILYWGGPVEPEQIFFIHSSDYKSKNHIISNKDFTITRDPKILLDIANKKGPEHYLILSGIAVWSSGQLDYEIKRGDWSKKLDNYIPIFNNKEEIWFLLNNSQDI